MTLVSSAPQIFCETEALQLLRNEFYRVIEEAQRLEPRTLVRLDVPPADAEAIAVQCQQATLQILGRARQAISLFEAFDDSACTSRSTCDVEGKSRRCLIHQAGDVAFIVQLELNSRHQRVRALTPGCDVLAALGECDSALRRVRRGFVAIDRVLENASSEPPPAFLSELAEALLVRRAYAKSRSQFRLARATHSHDPKRILHEALLLVGELADGETGSILRIRDRRNLMEIHTRLTAWLDQDETGDATGGERLIGDVDSFFELLKTVNLRQELRHHDAHVLMQLRAELELRGAAGFSSSSDLQMKLAPLQGLHDELDALIEQPSNLTAQSLLSTIERLAADFGFSKEQRS